MRSSAAFRATVVNHAARALVTFVKGRARARTFNAEDVLARPIATSSYRAAWSFAALGDGGSDPDQSGNWPSI
jgi:hypothetical protein